MNSNHAGTVVAHDVDALSLLQSSMATSTVAVEYEELSFVAKSRSTPKKPVSVHRATYDHGLVFIQVSGACWAWDNFRSKWLKGSALPWRQAAAHLRRRSQLKPKRRAAGGQEGVAAGQPTSLPSCSPGMAGDMLDDEEIVACDTSMPQEAALVWRGILNMGYDPNQLSEETSRGGLTGE